MQFAAGMATLHQQGYRIMLEIGTKPTLIGMGRQCLPGDDLVWLGSLHPSQSNWYTLWQSLTALAVRGVAIDWAGVDRGYNRQRVALPTYPFQRQRLWWHGAEMQSMPNPTANPTAVHPLGERLELPGTSEIRFQTTLSQDSPPYLSDHRLRAQPIAPAALYIELALMAGSIVLQSSQLRLDHYAIEQPLWLGSDPVHLQTVLTPNGGGYTVKLFSFVPGMEQSCTLHAIGQISTDGAALPLAAVADPMPLAGSVTDFYQTLRRNGFTYGACFQAVKQLGQGVGAAVGEVELPPDLLLEAPNYCLHPVLLDAGMQVVAAALATGGVSYVPVGVEQLRWQRSPDTTLRSYVQILEQSPALLKADVRLVNSTGKTVVDMAGLLLKSSQTPLSAGELDWRSSLYERAWIPQPPLPPMVSQPRHWLIFADRSIGVNLAERLHQRGDRCTLVFQATQDEPDQDFTIPPDRPEAYERIVQSIATSPTPPTDVVHLWSLQGSDALCPDQIESAQAQGCGSVLHLVQALAAVDRPPRLWLVTQGTQAIGSLPIQSCHAGLWGLAGSIRAEYPTLQCTCVDLDPILGGEEQLQHALQSYDLETQVAYRQGSRYVARLRPLPLPAHPPAPFQVVTTQAGTLEALTLVAATRRPPQTGEVEIQVCAVGLNFRDVLTALNLLPSPSGQQAFGGECAGRIVAIGAGVSDFKLGDAVMATQAIGCLGSYVTVAAAQVVPKPDSLTWAQAATITTAFLTAFHGLHQLAGMQPGDRVLIHAAAGGVGMAAVQLAQRAGAEVFATASPAKWEALKALGVKHLANSRSLDFADTVRQQTGDRGVDIVLNSLSGDFIPQSLSLLAKGGRFVELGKREIWTEEQIHVVRPDVDYAAFDLLEMATAPTLIPALLQQVMAIVERGEVRPLPYHEFPVEQVAIGFRFMAQAKHIGKVVITLPHPTPLRSDASYWITGGLGALGLTVAEELVRQGARHLVLLGRHPASPTAQQAIAQLHQTGATVTVVQADVAETGAIEQLIHSQPGHAPLRGIIHCAGVLQDSTLASLTWQDFQAVLAAKLQGTWNLHWTTRSLPLDFFVCFSSAAAILDTPGQGNYAAANAAMDAIMQHRHALGLAGTTINWGLWDRGMATALEERQRQRLIERGMTPIAPRQGMQVLNAVF
ncbi:MAG: SDR family NAD(P)-dependent oxidoreductase, partial [Leptolyngbyaceae cyanobacterium SL_7_1]|nr:SDR family NAD(P)-dependent oxidoreductase [Leptolyngbyaceae cyanobacterium SL_7_1]